MCIEKARSFGSEVVGGRPDSVARSLKEERHRWEAGGEGSEAGQKHVPLSWGPDLYWKFNSKADSSSADTGAFGYTP